MMSTNPYQSVTQYQDRIKAQAQEDFIGAVAKFELCLDPNDKTDVYNTRPNNVADWASYVSLCASRFIRLEDSINAENWLKTFGAGFAPDIVDEIGYARQEFARLVVKHLPEIEASLKCRLELDEGTEGATGRDIVCRQWLDAILASANSPHAGEFMAPVLIIRLAKAFRDVHLAHAQAFKDNSAALVELKRLAPGVNITDQLIRNAAELQTVIGLIEALASGQAQSAPADSDFFQDQLMLTGLDDGLSGVGQ